MARRAALLFDLRDALGWETVPNRHAVDCHTHIWAYPGHLFDEFVEEAKRGREGFRST